MDLYHADIRLPDNFVPPKGRVNLEWTSHAESARRDDRYGLIPRFTTATLHNLEIIEVGVEGGKVAKIVYRGPVDACFDVVMVLIPGRGNVPWKVKTVWLNRVEDTHKTLDRSKYIC